AWSIAERRHPQHAALDPAGQLLSIGALGALCYGLIAIGEQGLLAPVTLLALGAAIAGLLLFGIVERRVARPLLPLALFAVGRFRMLNLASFVLGFTAYASLFFLSLFFQQAQGHSAALAGSQLAPQFLLMGV
ncbi:MFS transporter, partial [Pseudomonas aeruginosa]|nr:MFS transporter [Pseudomonas aeruginosa]